MIKRKLAVKSIVMAGAMAALSVISQSASAQDTIKVGILHSLSGTMAISETTLKDVMLMLIDEQNKNCLLYTSPSPRDS